MITQKTINWLSWKIETDFPDLFSRLPKHDKFHSNPFADYRRIILENKLRSITYSYKDVIVGHIEKKDEKAIEQFLFGIEGVK